MERKHRATDHMVGTSRSRPKEEVWTFKRLAEDKPSIKIVRGWFRALAATIKTEDDAYFV